MSYGDIFVNRTLNLRKIKYIGFDMDHTLVRYHSHNFEKLAHRVLIEKLIKKKYPQQISTIKFDFQKAIRGLVIDKKNGNILKLSRWGAIRGSYHGTRRIDFETQKEIYKSTYIDLRDQHYVAIDTSFSIAYAVLYTQLVDFKDAHKNLEMPDYETIAIDLDASLDQAHRDGSLKGPVKENLDLYIQKSPEMVKALERYKKHDKKLFVVTNSDFTYTKLLLDYAITPYLSEHKSWIELFEFVVTLAKKPRFFWDDLDFYKINVNDGTLQNYYGHLTQGVYQGGCASTLTDSLKVSGDDILYIGDHIYSDILRIKKDCNWRTALVVEELDHETDQLAKARPLDQKIAILMDQKEPLEEELVELQTRHREHDKTVNQMRLDELQKVISDIDAQIAPLIVKRDELFNLYWGEVMRTGNEESYFARQMQSFACIYMSKIDNFLNCSPRSYYRAPRRLMPHEMY